jgi:hypothetical protein
LACGGLSLLYLYVWTLLKRALSVSVPMPPDAYPDYY